jgi:uncharacterized protein (DUF2236 family)
MARESVLRKGSPAWWYFGDPRNMLLGPQILVLQVAHPVVGAGVLEHSNYQQEPWQRLIRTAMSLTTVAYDNRTNATAEATRLRELHKSVKGVDGQGRRYHALNPEAYAWVHATLVRGAVEAQRLFNTGIPDERLPEFYAQMREVGLLLGLREHHMPPDLDAFDVYYDAMVADRLEHNQAVREVLVSIRHPVRPGPVPRAVWAPIAWFVGTRAYLVTVGTLPDVLRDRCGLAWSDRQERRLRRFARHVRWGCAWLLPPLFAAVRLIRTMNAVRRRLRGSTRPGW